MRNISALCGGIEDTPGSRLFVSILFFSWPGNTPQRSVEAITKVPVPVALDWRGIPYRLRRCVSPQRTSASSPPPNRNCDPTVGFIRRCFRLKCQTVCKPGSVPLRVCGGDGHSSGTSVAERLARPTRAAARKARPAAPSRDRGAACRSYLVLLPVGFALPPPLPAARCALTAPFHPCRPPSRGTDDGAWRCVSVALSLGSPPPGVTRHRASVEPGLSSLPPTARPEGERPSDRLAWDDMGCAPISANRPGESQARRPGPLRRGNRKIAAFILYNTMERANRTRPQIGIRRRAGTAMLFAADSL